MKVAHLSEPAEERVLFRDGLGVREWRETATGERVEWLHLDPVFAGVEMPLRDRVTRLAKLQHVKFARILSLEPARKGTGPILVSSHIAGTRLSEVLEMAGHGLVTFDPGTGLQVTRDVLAALAVLHDSRNVTHGALAPERVILTTSGRVVMVEHVLAQALDRLQLPRHQLWRDWRIATPPTAGPVRFDIKTDIAQAGLLALAALLGRPLEAEEYPHRLRGLLPIVQDRLGNSAAVAIAAEVVAWLERLVPVDSRRTFGTVRQAQQAYEALVSGGASAMGVSLARVKGVMAAVSAIGAASEVPMPTANPSPATPPIVAAHATMATAPADSGPSASAGTSEPDVEPGSAPAAPDEIDIQALLALEAELEDDEGGLEVLAQQRADLEQQFASLVETVAPAASEPPVRLIPETPASCEPLVDARVRWSSMPVEVEAPSTRVAAEEPWQVPEPVPAWVVGAPAVAVGDSDHGDAGVEATDLSQPVGAAEAFAFEPFVVSLPEERAPAAAIDHVPAEWWREALPWRAGDEGRADVVTEAAAPFAPTSEAADEIVEPPVVMGPSDLPAPESVDVAPAPDVADADEVVVVGHDAAPDAQGPQGVVAAVREEVTDSDAEPIGRSETVVAAVEERFGFLTLEDLELRASTIAFERTTETPSAEATDEVSAPNHAVVGTTHVADVESAAPSGFSEPDPAGALIVQLAPVADVHAVLAADAGPLALSTSFGESADSVADGEGVQAEDEGPLPLSTSFGESADPIADGDAVLAVDEGPLAQSTSLEESADPVADVEAVLAVDEGSSAPSASFEGFADAVGDVEAVLAGEEPVALASSFGESAVPVADVEAVATTGDPECDGTRVAATEEALEPAMAGFQPRHDPVEVQEPRFAVAEVEPRTAAASLLARPVEHDEEASSTWRDALLAETTDAPPLVAPAFFEESTATEFAAAGEPVADETAAPEVAPPEPDPVPEIVIVDGGTDGRAWDHLPSELPDQTRDAAADPFASPVGADTRPVEDECVESFDDDLQHASAASAAEAGDTAPASGRKKRRRNRRRRGANPQPLPLAASEVWAPAVASVETRPASEPFAPDEANLAGESAGVSVRPTPVRARSLLDREVPTWTPPADLGAVRQRAFTPVLRDQADAFEEGVAADHDDRSARGLPSAPAISESAVAPGTSGDGAALPPVASRRAIAQALPPAVEPVLQFEQEIRAVGMPDLDELAPRTGRAALTSMADAIGPVSSASARQTPGDHWPTQAASPGPKRGMNWRRLIAASVLIALFQGAAFAAWWWVQPGASGTLVVQTAQAGVEVLIDGTVIGKTPLREELAPGRHELTLRQGDKVREMPVEISLGVVTTQALDWPTADGGGKGHLQVTSTPTGAEVFIDGASRGKAPMLLEDLPAGTHELTLRSDAGTVTVATTVIAGETTPLEVPIFAGWILVDSPLEVSLVLGRKKIGSSMDGQILMPPGTHRVQAVNEALGIRQSFTVRVEPGAVERVAVQVPASPLQLQDEPGTEVFVDGERIGALPGALAIPVGTHDVRVRRPDGSERRQTITVRQGETVSM